MGWVIIAGIVGLFVLLWFIIVDEDILQGIAGFFGSVFLVLMIGVVFYFVLGECFTADTVYETETHPLLALSDHMDTSGHFFLGTGTIKESQQYFFIEQLNETDYQKSNVPCNKSVLRFSSEPRIERVKCRNSSAIINFFFYTSRMVYYIYIPSDSVVYQFSIDLD